jgi:hypothetical protein
LRAVRRGDDRDRGEPRGSSPATPPGKIDTLRLAALRSGSEGDAHCLRTGLRRAIVELPWSAPRRANAATHVASYLAPLVRSPAIARFDCTAGLDMTGRFVARRARECNGANRPRSRSNSRRTVAIAACESVSEPLIYGKVTCGRPSSETSAGNPGHPPSAQKRVVSGNHVLSTMSVSRLQVLCLRAPQPRQGGPSPIAAHWSRATDT